jgi:hypothetical protein
VTTRARRSMTCSSSNALISSQMKRCASEGRYRVNRACWDA